MMILADDVEAYEIEAAMDDIEELCERRRNEGRNAQAYTVALILIAEQLRGDNEPTIN